MFNFTKVRHAAKQSDILQIVFIHRTNLPEIRCEAKT